MKVGASDINVLYADEQKRLERFLVRRGVPASSAADIVQDAFVNMLRVPLGEVRDARSYLFRTARNLAVDAARADRRWARTFDDEGAGADIADPAPAPDAAIASREELAELAAALDALPPRAREVLVLHKFERLSYAEIAVRLGISKNTVMAHMVKAMSALRRRMAEHSLSHR